MKILKKHIIPLFLVSLLFVSCKFIQKENNKDISFIHLDSVPRSYLVDNINNDSLKKEILNFIIPEVKKQEKIGFYYSKGNLLYILSFYKKNKRTSYFINHKEDPGGWSSYELDHEDVIASFFISKKENNTTPEVWKFVFYGKNHELIDKVDTIYFKPIK